MTRRRRTWLRILGAAAVVGGLVWALSDCRAAVTLGSFNIRSFPDAQSDLHAIGVRIAELDADVFAVQEIREPKLFRRLVAEAGRSKGRQWRAVLGKNCSGSAHHVGVVYDANRFDLVDVRKHAHLDPEGRGACRDEFPPAILAVLDDNEGERFGMVSTHMIWGGTAEAHELRKRQWRSLLTVIEELELEYDGIPILAAGDFNSTGFLDDSGGERRFIDGIVQRHERGLPSRALQCTEYWQPTVDSPYTPSTLDHFMVKASGDWGEAEVLGMCAELRCKETGRLHPEYDTVSDHCPIRVRGYPDRL